MISHEKPTSLSSTHRPAKAAAAEPDAVYAPFGKFQLVAKLGRGGMGEVFLAVVESTKGINKLVVVKRLRHGLEGDASMRALFLDEGRLASRLNHPNVVQTIEVGEEGDALYLSMEFLEGQALNEIVRKLEGRPINHVMLCRIVSDVLAGLHYAHELRDYDGTPLGIVHRDLSPHNVFVTYDGVVKVLDFGIAKVSAHAEETEPGTVKGKVSYMAPEQLSAAVVDRRADIFVAGILLWELLAGRRLMAEHTVAQTVQRLLNEPILRVSSVVPSIDPVLDAIVARALERDPSQRFATAQEMRDALEEYIAGTGIAVRREDLGGIVTELFSHRRDRVRQQIKRYMNAPRAASSGDLPALAMVRRGLDTGSSTVLHGIPASIVSVSSTVPELSTSRRSQALTAGFLLVVAVGSLFAGLRSRPARQAAELSGASPPAMVVPSSAATPEPQPPPSLPASPVQPKAAERSESTPTSAPTALPRGIAASSPKSLAARAPSPTPVAVESPAPAPAASAPSSSSRRKFRTDF